MCRGGIVTPHALRPLIDGLLEAVWLVDPVSLRILCVNRVAGDLLGLAPEDLLDKPAIELTVTPEDQFFWEDVAAGLSDGIQFGNPVAGCRWCCRAGGASCQPGLV